MVWNGSAGSDSLVRGATPPSRTPRAAGTIGLAELYGLPVSTTHILSSGVAGTMAANGSGLQMSTVRNMALAWVLTLPAAITLAAVLFFILRHVF